MGRCRALAASWPADSDMALRRRPGDGLWAQGSCVWAGIQVIAAGRPEYYARFYSNYISISAAVAIVQPQCFSTGHKFARIIEITGTVKATREQGARPYSMLYKMPNMYLCYIIYSIFPIICHVRLKKTCNIFCIARCIACLIFMQHLILHRHII